MRRVAATSLLALALAGCATPPATGGTGASLTVSPRLADARGRGVLAVLQPITAADVGQVRVALYDQATGGTLVATAAAAPAASLTFKHLRYMATYRIEAEAYASDAVTRLDAVATPVVVAVGANDAPANATIPIRLRDRVFDGQVTAGLPIATGGFDPLTPAAIAVGPQEQVDTVAGFGGEGVRDDAGALAMFKLPEGLAAAPDGTIYVADTGSRLIRKLSGGAVTTVAGTPTDLGASPSTPVAAPAAYFPRPIGLAVDASGAVWIGDATQHTIRRLWAGTVTLEAGIPYVTDLPFTDRLSAPHQIAFGPDGALYIADTGNNTIRKLTPGGALVPLANPGGSQGDFDSPATASVTFNHPQGVAVGPDGTVYVADTDNRRIRKIIPGGGVTTLTGLASPPYVPAGYRVLDFKVNDAGQDYVDGPASEAVFNHPVNLCLDGGTHLLVTDDASHVVRRVRLSDGYTTTLAGSHMPGWRDGPAHAASFYHPRGIVFHGGAAYLTDTLNHRIRRIQ